MEPLAYVFIIVVLAIFMYFQIVRSRDRGIRGRALGRLAKYFECEFEVGVPDDVKRRLGTISAGSLLTVRNHIRCTNAVVPIDFIDVRYAFGGAKKGIATSTVGRFDYDGPVFRCTPNPDPRPSAGTQDEASPETEAGPAAPTITLDHATFDERRLLSSPDAAAVRNALSGAFADLAIGLRDIIVESDGTQVLVYSWRARVLPNKIPEFMETVTAVAEALQKPGI